MVSVNKAKRRYLKWERYTAKNPMHHPLGGISSHHVLPRGYKRAWNALKRAYFINQYGGIFTRAIDERHRHCWRCHVGRHGDEY